jgi:predicted hydrocarbon binding protein
MITEPLTAIQSADKVVWMSKPIKDRKVISEITDYTILSLVDCLLKIADRGIAAEILMVAAELLGQKLYDDFVKKEFPSPKEWVENINRLIFEPMGTKIKWVDITDTQVKAEIFQCPTVYRAALAPEVVCAFSYGFGRILWRRAFPEGEMIMSRETLALGGPTCPSLFVIRAEKSIRQEMIDMIKTAKPSMGKDIEPKELTDFSLLVGDYTIIALTETIFKMLDKKDASEVIITAAENLGKIIFGRKIGKKLEKWTTMDWAKITSAYIWNPQSIGIVFSEISDEKIVCHVFKCPTPERAGKAPHIVCPFSWGYARGIWREAFSEGEVLMGGTMAHGAPTCQFLFFVKAKREHSEEREKIKRYLTKEEELRML